MLKTMIAPPASAIKRSIFESKAMSAKRRLVISADRTTIAFAELLEKGMARVHSASRMEGREKCAP
jgi:hypothetical protein